jgi:phage tail sheath gpL-like
VTVEAVVSPSVKSPGVYLSFDLKGGAGSPGTAPLRALILATKSTSGTITADTQLEKGVSVDDIKALLGTGTPGFLARKRLDEEYRLALVDVVSPAVNGSAVTATAAINFDGTITSAHTVRVWVAGRRIEFVWAAGESQQTIAERCRDKINAFGDEMPVTAAAAINGAGPSWDCTLSYRIGGPIGNDCRVYVQVIGGAGGTVAAPAGNTLASGAGEPDFATAITTIVGEEYDIILCCCSNADVQDGSASSNPGKVAADMALRSTGAEAKLQQQIVGATSTLTGIKTGTGNLNDEETQVPFCLEGQSLPSEWAGAEAGARLREHGINPAKNRIALAFRSTLYGPFNLSADRPTQTEKEDALNTGVSIVSFTDSGTAFPVRPITTYHKDTLANPDARVLDVTVPTGMFAVLKDLRVALPQEYPQKNLSANLEPGDDPPPPDVVEVRDVMAFVNQRMRFWIGQGVVRRDKWEADVAAGTFAGNVNASDESQLDLQVPYDIIKPLAKIGVNAKRA